MIRGLSIYRAATGSLEPALPALLRRRVAQGKEDPERLRERLGFASSPRPEGPLVWLHGASVGESLSHLPIVERFARERPELTLVVTSGTVASAALLRKRLPPRAIHQFAPLDGPRSSRRFLDHWRPDLCVFVESELWPNLILGAKARGAKLALLSARLSEDSFRNWARFKGAAREVLGAFDRVLAQDGPTAKRLARLGARDDGRLNLKYAGDPLPYDAKALDALQAELGARPVVLAASTHPGEDEVVLQAFEALGERSPSPLLVLVPRHVARGPGLAAVAEQHGLGVRLRSAAEPIDEDVNVLVGDTFGELGLWFRLARTALVAGTLVKGIGGHNPLEPARLDCPAIAGPYAADWAGVYRTFDEAQALVRVSDARQLAAAWAEDLDDARAARARAARARKVAEANADVAARAWTALQDLLP